MAGSEGSFTVIPNDFLKNGGFTPSEKLVLLSLLCYTNTETGRAWPSQSTIAHDMNLSRRCVIETLKRLEERGVIETEKKHGAVTQYKVKTCALSAHVQEVHMCNDCTSPVQPLHTPCANTAHPPVQNLHTINTNIQTLNTNTNDKHEKAPAKSAKKKAADFDADFEEFWQAYPKPKNPDKSPGRQRYTALRKKGVSADDLLKAAQNYARAMRGTDPRYIKHSATFLGPSDAWRDYLHEPETARSDELPDAAAMFPNLAEWMRRQGGEQVG